MQVSFRSLEPRQSFHTMTKQMMKNRVTQALSIVALTGSIAVSVHTTQTSPSAASNVIDRDAFEVASIRPVDPQRLPGGLTRVCSGGFELTSGRITING